MKTRFKMWYRLIGSALEHAAALCGREFGVSTNCSGAVEDEDEDDVSLGEVLAAMNSTWPDKEFKAKDVADIINTFQHEYQDIFHNFFCPTLDAGRRASPLSIGKKLKHHMDGPVVIDGKTLTLKVGRPTSDSSKGALQFKVVISV